MEYDLQGSSASAPDLTDYVIGFRSWHNEEVLEGSFAQQLPSLLGIGWVPGKNTARCGAGRSHISPDKDCECGLYAFHHAGQARRSLYGEIVGAIKAWGKLQVGPRRFRAQYAEIIAFSMSTVHRSHLYPSVVVNDDGDEEMVIPNHHERLKSLADQFGVPVVAWSDLESYAYQFGKKPPSSLLPSRPQKKKRPPVPGEKPLPAVAPHRVATPFRPGDVRPFTLLPAFLGMAFVLFVFSELLRLVT